MLLQHGASTPLVYSQRPNDRPAQAVAVCADGQDTTVARW